MPGWLKNMKKHYFFKIDCFCSQGDAAVILCPSRDHVAGVGEDTGEQSVDAVH